MDLSAAFDTADHSSLLRRLERATGIAGTPCSSLALEFSRVLYLDQTRSRCTCFPHYMFACIAFIFNSYGSYGCRHLSCQGKQHPFIHFPTQNPELLHHLVSPKTQEIIKNAACPQDKVLNFLLNLDKHPRNRPANHFLSGPVRQDSEAEHGADRSQSLNGY